MTASENNASVALSEKQEKLSGLRRCGDFLCKHWNLAVAAGLVLVGKLPALPLAIFFGLREVSKNCKINNETVHTAVLALGFITGIGGMIVYRASLPPTDGKVLPFSVGYQFQNEAHDIVVGRIQNGENIAPEEKTYKNWLSFGHWTPVMETVHVDGERKCRNIDNTKLLMKVGGSMEGYMRPNKQSKWERVYDMSTFPYAEACAPH